MDNLFSQAINFAKGILGGKGNLPQEYTQPKQETKPKSIDYNKVKESISLDRFIKPETQNIVKDTVKGLPGAWTDTIIGKNRSVEPGELGGVAGILAEMGSSFLRAPIALTNYASGKTAKGINKVFGSKIEEDTSSWTRKASQFLDQTSPEASAVYKGFLGLSDDAPDANVERVGKEYADLINMTLPKDIEISDKSKLIPLIGVAGSLLDGATGGNASKVALKTALKRAGNVDELADAVRAFTKNGNEDDIARFANELWETKGKSDFDILKKIEAENASKSTIQFEDSVLKNGEISEEEIADKIQKRFKDNAKEIVDKKTTATTAEPIKNADALLRDKEFTALYDSKVIDPDKVDNFVLNFDTFKKQDDVLESIFKKVQETDSEYDDILKKLKTKYNLKQFDDMPLSKRKSFAEELLKNADGFSSNKKLGNLSKLVSDINKGAVDGDYVSVVSSVEDFAENAVKNMNDLAQSAGNKFASGRIDDAIQDIYDIDIIESALGKGLRATQDVKFSGLNATQKRIKDAVRVMRKDGLDPEQSSKLFSEYMNKNNISKIDDLTTKQIDDILASSFSLTKKIGDMINMYRYSNMLSNIATQVINTSSNVSENLLMKPVVMLGEAIVDALGITKGGSSAGDIATYFGKVFESKNISNAYKEAKDVFNEISDFKNTDISRTSFKGGLIAKIYRTPLRLLEASDAMAFNLFKSGNEAVEFRRALKKAKVDKISDLPTKVYRDTIKKAEKLTEDNIFRLTKDGDMDGMITRLFKGSARFVNNANNQMFGIPKIFIPFVNTISVLGKKTVRSTPLLGLLDAFRLEGGSLKKIDDMQTLLGEQFAGTLLALSGYAIHQKFEDVYKGNRPESQSVYQYSDKEGTNYNTVRIGERWNDLDFLGPKAPAVLLGMKISQIVKDFKINEEGKEKLFGALISAITIEAFKEAYNNEFMKQSFDVIGLVSGKEDYRLPAVMANTIRQFAPMSSLMGALNKVFNDNRKVVGPETFDEVIMQAFKDMPNFAEILKTGEYSTISDKIPQAKDKDGIPLYYGGKDDSTGRKLLSAISPSRPQLRDENIHNKYLEEKERAELRDAVKSDSTKVDTENDISMIENIMSGNVPEELKSAYKERISELGESGIKDIIDEYENRNESQGSRYINDIVSGRGTEEAKQFLKQASPEELDIYVKEYETREVSKLKLVVEKVVSGKGTAKDKEILKSANPELLEKAVTSYENSLE